MIDSIVVPPSVRIAVAIMLFVISLAATTLVVLAALYWFQEAFTP